jgi:hypothetical protein
MHAGCQMTWSAPLAARTLPFTRSDVGPRHSEPDPTWGGNMNSHLTSALIQARQHDIKRAAERQRILADLPDSQHTYYGESYVRPRWRQARASLRNALSFPRRSPRQTTPSVARKAAGV